jgi:hypothetical protein
MKRFNKINRGFALTLAFSFCIAMAGRYASARSMGLGGSFVAVADEPLGVIWNPAGLSEMYQNAAHFETVRLFEETSINGFSLGVPGKKFPSFGATVLSLSSGEFERTNDLNERLGTFNIGEMAFLLSIAKNLNPKFTVGANVKLAHQSIVDFSASGVGMDLGFMYKVVPNVRLGASLLNVGGPTLTMRSTDEDYSVEFRGGMAVYFYGNRGLVTAEIDHRSGPGATLHAGSEFWIHRTLALRFGIYDTSPGGGLSYVISDVLRLDYGISDHELGTTHRIGIGYRFGGFYASSEATPSIFSPIGEQSVTRFNLKAKSKADISRWRLEIVDKSDQVVRSFSGRGAPPAHVMWDGKSERGLSLPDGLYRYWLVVTDVEGHEILGSTRTVEITTAGPQGAVPIVVE